MSDWPSKNSSLDHHQSVISFELLPVLVWLTTNSHSTSILHERIVLGQVEGRLRSAVFLGNAHYQGLIATLRYHIIE